MAKLRDLVKLTPLIDTLKLVKIDDAEYFSSKYGSYISNSRLGLLNPFQGGSADAFFAGFKDEGFVSSLVIGSAVHCLNINFFLHNKSPLICDTLYFFRTCLLKFPLSIISNS